VERLKDDSQLNMVTNRMEVDGKLWSTTPVLDPVPARPRDRQVRGDGPLTALPGGKSGYSIYDVRADSKNNAFVTDFQKNHVVKIDAQTLKYTVYQTGTQQSRNRRGRIDENDRFFFAQYRGNKLTMFDPRKRRWPSSRCRPGTPIPMT